MNFNDFSVKCYEGFTKTLYIAQNLIKSLDRAMHPIQDQATGRAPRVRKAPECVWNSILRKGTCIFANHWFAYDECLRPVANKNY
jgi:hypothetical protein